MDAVSAFVVGMAVGAWLPTLARQVVQAWRHRNYNKLETYDSPERRYNRGLGREA